MRRVPQWGFQTMSFRFPVKTVGYEIRLRYVYIDIWCWFVSTNDTLVEESNLHYIQWRIVLERIFPNTEEKVAAHVSEKRLKLWSK